MGKKKVCPLPAKERLGWIDSSGSPLSLNTQLSLLSLGKSHFYYQSFGENARNLELMRLMDEIYLKYLFYGVPRMHASLRQRGYGVNPKRVERLYRIMGLEAIYQKPRLSQRDQNHEIYPYLLKSLDICRSNQVWSTDITYVPMEKGFLFKVAFIDWYSRYLLSYAISNTLDFGFVSEAFLGATRLYGNPEILNTDQGSQFTSKAFTGMGIDRNIRISMDGKGRALDNVRIERYWRSYKYECVYLHSIQDGWHLKGLTDEYIRFYNTQRPHQSLGYQTPWDCYSNGRIQDRISWGALAAPQTPGGGFQTI